MATLSYEEIIERQQAKNAEIDLDTMPKNFSGEDVLLKGAVKPQEVPIAIKAATALPELASEVAAGVQEHASSTIKNFANNFVFLGAAIYRGKNRELGNLPYYFGNPGGVIASRATEKITGVKSEMPNLLDVAEKINPEATQAAEKTIGNKLYDIGVALDRYVTKNYDPFIKPRQEEGGAFQQATGIPVGVRDVTAGALQFGEMLLLSVYVTPVAGIGYISSQVLGSETQKRFGPEGKNLYDMTDEEIDKYLLTTIGSTGVQTALESVPLTRIMNKIKVPPQAKVNFINRVINTALPQAGIEGVTEFGQDLVSFGFDIADKTDTIKNFWPRVREAVGSAVIGTLIGFGSGFGVGVYNRNRLSRMYQEELGLPPEKATAVANAQIQNSLNTATALISDDVDMQTKRGALFDSVRSAVSDTVNNNKMIFDNEADKANYVSTVSNNFADTAVIEAFRRNIPIEQIVSPENIEAYVNEQGNAVLGIYNKTPDTSFEPTENFEENFTPEEIQAAIEDSQQAIEQEQGTVSQRVKQVFAQSIDSKIRIPEVGNPNRGEYDSLDPRVKRMFFTADQTKGISWDQAEMQLQENRPDESFWDFMHRIEDLYLNQSPRRGKRGKKGYTDFTPEATLITLLERADASTLPHELAHYWLQNIFDYTQTGQATPEYMNRFGELADFLGVQPGQTQLTREQHERFAEAYEKYLYDGTAPGDNLKTMFNDYSRWLRKVYDDSKDIGQFDVELSPVARNFFDSMLTGQTKIAQTIDQQLESAEKRVEIATIEAMQETGEISPLKERALARGVQNINEVSDTSKEIIKNDPRNKYMAITNKATLNKAKQFVDANYSEGMASNALDERVLKDNMNVDDIAVAIEYSLRLDKDGQYAKATNIFNNIAKQATAKGQEIQILRYISRQTPTGKLQDTLSRAEAFNRGLNDQQLNSLLDLLAEQRNLLLDALSNKPALTENDLRLIFTNTKIDKQTQEIRRLFQTDNREIIDYIVNEVNHFDDIEAFINAMRSDNRLQRIRDNSFRQQRAADQNESYLRRLFREAKKQARPAPSAAEADEALYRNIVRRQLKDIARSYESEEEFVTDMLNNNRLRNINDAVRARPIEAIKQQRYLERAWDFEHKLPQERTQAMADQLFFNKKFRQVLREEMSNYDSREAFVQAISSGDLFAQLQDRARGMNEFDYAQDRFLETVWNNARETNAPETAPRSRRRPFSRDLRNRLMEESRRFESMSDFMDYYSEGNRLESLESEIKDETALRRQIDKTIKRIREKGGVVVSEEQENEILNRQRAINQMPDGRAKDIEIHRMNQWLAQMFPSKTSDKIMTVWKAFILSSPQTQYLNTLSTFFNFVRRDIINRNLGAGFDTIASIFTGKRTESGGMSGIMTGLAESYKNIKDFVRYGYSPRDFSKNLNLNNTYIKNPVLRTFSNAVFKTLQISDQIFFYMSYNISLYSQAESAAMNLNLKGQEYKTAVQELVNNPTEEMRVIANNHALVTVFQDATVLGNVARSATTQFKPLQYVIPFTKTPSSVVMQMAKVLPGVGIVVDYLSMKKDKSMYKIDRTAQEQFTQLAANQATGLLVFYLLGLLMDADITGDYPDDDKERKLWAVEGKKAYSIKIAGKWWELNNFGVIGAVISAGSTFKKTYENTGDYLRSMVEGGASAFANISDQTYTRDLQDFLRIFYPARNESRLDAADRYVQNFAISFIPAIVNMLSMTTDDTMRRTPDLMSKFQNRTPLRDSLEPRVDILGNEVKYSRSQLESVLRILAPRYGNANESDPTALKLRSLYDEVQNYNGHADNQTADVKLSFGRLAGANGFDELTPEENTQMFKDAGKYVKTGLERIFSRPNFDNLPLAARAGAVSDVFKESNKRARKEAASRKIVSMRKDGKSEAEIREVTNNKKSKLFK